MRVGFTRDTEKNRVANEQQLRQNSKWEIERSTSMVPILRKAKDLGWYENKVQVRVETSDQGNEYVIEPFEEGCGCRGLLKYSHFFDAPNQ